MDAPWDRLARKLANEGFAEHDHEEEEAPHHSWRETYANNMPRLHRGAEVRLARKDPKLWVMAHLLAGSPKEAVEKIAGVREVLAKKEAGSWEQGSGGATSGVYAMTPGALGIPGNNLGGMSTFQNLAAMQMRPTFGSSMAFGGGGISPIIQNYRAMGRGEPLSF